jgi:PadR family transcriptional regulator, regulatory protein PadR
MTRQDALGEFEQAVLLAVAHLEVEAYGVTIRREIETRTGRTVAVGALYTAIDRLERKGYVTSTMSDPTPVRGGRSKRQVTLSPAGRAALRQSRDFLARMWSGLRLGAPRRRT